MWAGATLSSRLALKSEASLKGLEGARSGKATATLVPPQRQFQMPIQAYVHLI